MGPRRVIAQRSLGRVVGAVIYVDGPERNEKKKPRHKDRDFE